MRLSLVELLKEQSEVYESPKQNVAVFFDKARKTIKFSPIQKARPVSDVQTLIDTLKSSFRVKDVKIETGNVYIVELNPAEQIEKVETFIKSQLEEML